MRLRSLTWASDMALLIEASRGLGVDLRAWSAQDISLPGGKEECLNSLKEGEIILLHPFQDPGFEEISKALANKKVISFGIDQALWGYSTVPTRVTATANAYIAYGGIENIKNMIKYLGKELLGESWDHQPPQERLWEGVYHPDAPEAFPGAEEYLAWYGPRHEKTVGILFFRTYWANGDLEIVNALVRELEKDVNVIPAFCLGMGDKDLGAKSSGEVVEEFFSGRVDLVINLQSLFYAGSVDRSVEALKRLNVPVLHPLTVYHKSEEEWRADIHGMDSAEVGWSVAIPEFEGLIEPILVGTARRTELEGQEFERHSGVRERVERIARRARKWIALRGKPPSERRVAFILHNNPCASAEATVGTGAHLDTLESVAVILKRMAAAGYAVEAPESGKELIEAIMDRKAISEFRWTPIEEILSRGGALALISREDYLEWFQGLPQDVREKVCQAWGEPPGETREGIPPAMVYQGKIVVTGLRYGNALVCVQPKRGCAGSRCDGQVCRILHDPEVPPTHQYMATYRFLERDFLADVIVHVGTHGNLEFLPGKSVALSQGCFPDIAIGDLPHLYIYNSDNPPEGTIAKRRSYAVLIDHMQTVMTLSGLYGDLKELEDRMAEYHRTKVSEKGRAHALEHIILDLLKRTNLAGDMDLEGLLENGSPFEIVLERAHQKISEMYGTQIPDGMHIFGQVPEGSKRVEMIASILRYGSELEGPLAEMMGPDYSESPRLEEASRRLISTVLEGSDPLSVLQGNPGEPGRTALASLGERILELSSRIEASDEMGSLLRGMEGGFIPPGPSGLITRGKPEVLPTGRNFYSLDPGNIPTEAAGKVGKRLAESLIEKFEEEHGRIPENVAMYWMANDIMWADGEQLAQMLHLMGVEPLWRGGRVSGYRIIPLEELGRPRIDLTVRVSGITRDCFYNCIEFLDGAIREVAALDEPPEMNYLRKHFLENKEALRIFASRPGTYGNGVNLAVYASAWKEEKDLTDIFIQWNSYAYGRGVFGKDAKGTLVSQLRSVDITFNKTVTDEYDLFGCCCYFGTHGGLTGAAKELSGHEITNYYGDTRERDRVEIRTLAEEVRRVARTKLLNPKWIEGMKRHGYKGAGDISKRVGRVYGWEATTREVDDWIFDDIAKTFILDEENRRFFQEKNPWAMEEIGRRLLEAHQRGLWEADKEVLEALKTAYLEIEGWMEERVGGEGQFQGGAINVVTIDGLKRWRDAE